MTHYSQRVLIGLGVGLGVSFASFLYYKFLKRETIPKKWKRVGTLEELCFYPLKSCAAVEIVEGMCDILGTRVGDIRDRALMLIDDGGILVSARTYPNMFKIIPRIVSKSKIIISGPGMKDIEFDYSLVGEYANGETKALIWGFHATVMDCGEKFHRWFSQCVIGQPEGLRLVYYPHSHPTRPVASDLLNGICTSQDTGALQDTATFMLINKVSVSELNTRLSNPVPPMQFRGNFYVSSDGKAFEEDHWSWVKIGDAVFRVVGPCYRCIMPNINPSSAQRDPEGEPLRTLKKYRVFPGAPTKSPAMGIHFGPRILGKVKRGDIIYAEDL